MDWRVLYKKHAKKWAAHIIVALVLLAILLDIAHQLHYLEWIPGPALSATVGTASVLLIALLLEAFFASDENFDDLTKKSQRKMDFISQRLDALSQRIDSTADATMYSEVSTFISKWQDLREKFDIVMLIGELPISYAEEFRRICDQDEKDQQAIAKKEFSVYRSVNNSSMREVIELIEVAATARPVAVNFYHIFGFEWGSWVVGSNRRGETEILLNYTNAQGGALAGVHLSGKTAESFAKIITRNLNESGISEASYPAVRLASREQVDFVVEEKAEYQKRIIEMVEMGIPIEGVDGICEEMSDLIQHTQNYLHVTHLCIDEGTIERLQDEAFREWLDANYKAVQRGVKIRRIFIVPKKYYNHPVLEKTRAEMQSKNVEVLMCRLDNLRMRLQEDFSIYDGQHLLYIDKTRIHWSATQQLPLARRSENPHKIKEYSDIFSSLETLVDT